MTVSRARRPRWDPSIEGLIGGVVGLTLVYIGAEAFLAGPLHPVHWAAAALGGGTGFLIGHAVYRFQAGDDMPFRRPDGRRAKATRRAPRQSRR